MRYPRLVSRRLRANLSTGIRRIAPLFFGGDSREAMARDLEAVRAFLADASRPPVAPQRNAWQSGDHFSEIVACIDRIARRDALLANDLRRALGTRLFAPLAGAASSSAWLNRAGWTTRVASSTVDREFEEVLAAIAKGCNQVNTSSLNAAYLSALADIPVVVELDAQVSDDETSVLRDLARLPALSVVLAGTSDIRDHTRKIIPESADKIRISSAVENSGPDFGATFPSSASVGVMAEGPPQDRLLSRHGAAAFVVDASAPPKLLWLYGSEEQSAWAYGINARRLAKRLTKYRHFMGSKSKRQTQNFDIKFSFDILIARQGSTRRIRAAKSVLRVGGANPLKEASGGSRSKLASYLAGMDGVITLSPELKDAISAFHPNVFFIPNGIDLDEWKSGRLSPRTADHPFCVGMAASLRQRAEQELKGYQLAVEACELAGVQLYAVGRGIHHVPHDRMIQDFYSQIDVLIHPTGPGKEACSNVIMESLALGVPVITTRYAGMHGHLLANGVEALIVPRFSLSLAAAIRELRNNEALRRVLAAGGRHFAERTHDLDAVAGQYERVFDAVLGRAPREDGQS